MNEHPYGSDGAADPLDTLLRESDSHLPDNGFTARVLVSLPPRRAFDRTRLLLFAAAWLAGAVILVLRAPAVGPAIISVFEHFHEGDGRALVAVVPIIIAFGALVWALVSWGIEEWA